MGLLDMLDRDTAGRQGPYIAPDATGKQIYKEVQKYVFPGNEHLLKILERQ